MQIKDILSTDEQEKLTRFDKDEISWLNKRIKKRKDGKPGVSCIVRGKNIDNDYYELTPEEIVRQLYAQRLINKYGYLKEFLSFEIPVFYAGHEKVIDDKRIDIAVYDDKFKSKLLFIVEVKRPNVTDPDASEDNGATPKQQLASYAKQKCSPIAVLVNGGNIQNFYRSPDFEHSLMIDNFPAYKENIEDWLNNQRFTLKQLMIHDRLKRETLKNVILNVEQRFSANDSSDKAFDEIFKLIFTKLYDEKSSSDDADEIAVLLNKAHLTLDDINDEDFRVLQFRATDKQTPEEVFINVAKLFEEAKIKWPGIFPKNSTLKMQPNTVKSCVKELQNVKLFNSNLEVVDEAFEHLVNKDQKGEMGQYFTPRYIIDMCVKMLNPKQDESMIDTAAGSCGFPMHTIFHCWKKINPEAYNLLTTNKRTSEEIDYVKNKVFGIDFSEKSVRVGRMLNIVAGDGHTNVIELNSLDYKNWTRDYISNQNWSEKYIEGFNRLLSFCKNKNEVKDEHKFKEFEFDILMANPPFSGDLDNIGQIEQYVLGHKNGDVNEKLQNKIDRDILFIERNLNFLKPGGRMAIVLPQGRLNNANEKYLRKYIMDSCRILAVIGLHPFVFKPHTSTKTSVLFLQKWTDDKCGYPNICPKQINEKGEIDYPIFFAVMQEPSKNTSGDKIYVAETYIRWKTFEYITKKVYIRKSDNVEFSLEEYKEAMSESNFKKSLYKEKIITEAKITEKQDNNGNYKILKNYFIKEFGSLDSHRFWILDNIEFVLKKNRINTGLPKKLNFEKFIRLNDNEKNYYKKVQKLGLNKNKPIGISEYNDVESTLKKYYLPKESVEEFTERIRDSHGHIFVKHDLFNHDPKINNINTENMYSKDGIAEAFLEFANNEGLSFV